METPRQYINNATHLCNVNQNKNVTIEHMLYVLTKLSNEFITLFKDNSDGNISLLKHDLSVFITDLEKDYRGVPPIVDQDLHNAIYNSPTIKDFIINICNINNCKGVEFLSNRGFDFEKIGVREIKQRTILDEFTTNLNELAKEGKIDDLIGREYELNRMIQILLRKNKCSPILVGEAGVGKTAIIEGLALAIHNGEIIDELKDYQVYSLSMIDLLSSVSLESTLSMILDELSKTKSILFIDEIHTIVGTGSSKNADMSNLLKPILARGTIKIIGATTFLEYKNTIEKNKALNRRFSKIDVDEPNEEECIEILKGIRSKFENYHKVKISDDILVKATQYGKKYFIDRYLPDSAIDIIDELGSSCKIHNNSSPTIEDLNVVLTKMTKTKKNYEFNNGEKLKHLENTLKENIYGQDNIIADVLSILERNYAGLGNDSSPLGIFLFAGNSGTGKTEFCKKLAEGLGIHFERFDMSEYGQSHEYAKLIGSPAGYVGYDDGGILTNAIRSNPYCVLLFDEIEKAHPKIMNTFLQIFDNAMLTDGSGIKVNFKNTIIVMTSNLGTKEPNSMGFIEEVNKKEDIAVKDFFAPEFINRIDKICYFNDLDKKALYDIVDKEINILSNKIKGLTIEIDDSIREFLVNKGYKKEYGARILKRVIYNEISSKLSKEILYGDLKENSKVKFKLKDDTIIIK